MTNLSNFLAVFAPKNKQLFRPILKKGCFKQKKVVAQKIKVLELGSRTKDPPILDELDKISIYLSTNLQQSAISVEYSFDSKGATIEG